MDTPSNFPQFPKFACAGDSINWSSHGFDFVARLQCDTDTRPTDFDCYSPEEVIRWENDEWFYVSVVLSVSFDGLKLLDNAASLWGVECNFSNTSNAYLADVAQELEADAINAARVEMGRINQVLHNYLSQSPT